MKTKKITQFLAFFIIFAAVLTFSSCNDKEETFDDIPKELQNTQWGESTTFYSFSVTSWSYTKDTINSFTISDLTVNRISNNHDDKATYPSGYEIMGKVKASRGSYTSTHPVGKYITYQFYLSTDKENISIYYLTNQ
jgi:hypothetical protein